MAESVNPPASVAFESLLPPLHHLGADLDSTCRLTTGVGLRIDAGMLVTSRCAVTHRAGPF